MANTFKEGLANLLIKNGWTELFWEEFGRKLTVGFIKHPTKLLIYDKYRGKFFVTKDVHFEDNSKSLVVQFPKVYKYVGIPLDKDTIIDEQNKLLKWGDCLAFYYG